jgi:hypothetical protein
VLAERRANERRICVPVVDREFDPVRPAYPRDTDFQRTPQTSAGLVPFITKLKDKKRQLRGLSPRANYTDRATADCQ